MPTPILFIHGLWLHADSWKPWVERFRAAGYGAAAFLTDTLIYFPVTAHGPMFREPGADNTERLE